MFSSCGPHLTKNTGGGGGSPGDTGDLASGYSFPTDTLPNPFLKVKDVILDDVDSMFSTCVNFFRSRSTLSLFVCSLRRCECCVAHHLASKQW